MVNRFSQDMSLVDMELPLAFANTLICNQSLCYISSTIFNLSCSLYFHSGPDDPNRHLLPLPGGHDSIRTPSLHHHPTPLYPHLPPTPLPRSRGKRSTLYSIHRDPQRPPHLACFQPPIHPLNRTIPSPRRLAETLLTPVMCAEMAGTRAEPHEHGISVDVNRRGNCDQGAISCQWFSGRGADQHHDFWKQLGKFY